MEGPRKKPRRDTRVRRVRGSSKRKEIKERLALKNVIGRTFKD